VEGQEEDLRVAQQAAVTQNALSQNGLSQNGLSQNGLSQNGLSQNGLSQNGLLMAELAANPLAQMFLKYVMSCALPADRSITLTINNTPVAFDGGLAPTWGIDGGSCDATCTALVSSCVLSRVNFLGEHVPLSLRGSAPGLASLPAEREAYPNREATYYGDVFASPQIRFACKSPGSNLIARVCGDDYATTGCIMTIVGDCDAACDPPLEDGSFPNCHDALHDAAGIYPAGTQAFPNPITVYRQ
jgi:hypothetical protein